MKGKGSALAIIIGGKGKPEAAGGGEEPEEKAEEGGDELDIAADELLDALGVPDDKRGRAKEALESYCHLCAVKAMQEEKAEGDDKY